MIPSSPSPFSLEKQPVVPQLTIHQSNKQNISSDQPTSLFSLVDNEVRKEKGEKTANKCPLV